MRTLIDPLYKRVGYEERQDDKHLDIYLRTLAVAWACSLDHAECKEKTGTEYSVWMDKLESDKEEQNP